jgi:hypothetical protein
LICAPITHLAAPITHAVLRKMGSKVTFVENFNVMYIEKQYFSSPILRGLKWISGGVLLVQLGLFVASESGAMRLPFGYSTHLIGLFIVGIFLILLNQIGLQLLITEGGINLRFWLYQFQMRHISWTEIRRIKLIDPKELPEDAFWRLPNRDEKHIYLLTNQQSQVLLIELLNGTHIFISIKNASKLLDFLQNSPKPFIV